LNTSWIELVIALLIAGIGISMALPTVPTAVLSAVAPQQVGKASGINYMAQRFGAVFAIAIGSTIFGTYGGFGSAASVTAGFKPRFGPAAPLPRWERSPPRRCRADRNQRPRSRRWSRRSHSKTDPFSTRAASQWMTTNHAGPLAGHRRIDR
jgi:MFS family permease